MSSYIGISDTKTVGYLQLISNGYNYFEFKFKKKLINLLSEIINFAVFVFFV